MSGRHPYLQRRGGRYFFRIAVPAALRVAVGSREITKTLNTGDRRAAEPRSLEIGAAAKQLFRVLRMSPGCLTEWRSLGTWTAEVKPLIAGRAALERMPTSNN